MIVTYVWSVGYITEVAQKWSIMWLTWLLALSLIMVHCVV